MGSISQIYLLLFVLIIISTVIKILMPQIKGKIGEKTVSLVLRQLEKENYSILNNVILKSTGGSTKTTQIDHVVVSAYGLFVVETKNYKGQIYGSEKSQQWTQNIYGHKYKIMNPVHQNYAHIKALETILTENGYVEIPIYSVIAFPGDTELKMTTTESCVVNYGAIAKRIRALSATRVFTEEQVGFIVCLLQNANTLSKETVKEHVNDIQKVKEDNDQKMAKGICPKCGGNLIRRKGKYGYFYGCSNYPKCRFTMTMR